MTRPPAPVHYLRPNHAEWSPPACIFLDTETTETAREDSDVLSLRCWDAHYIDRRTPKSVRARDVWGSGTTVPELVAWLDVVTRNRETVWVYAHNLAFDLATTRLPLRLAAAGWTVTDFAIGGRSPWMRLSRGKRVLTFADSWSWLPHALAEVGAAVQVAKPELPDEADELAAWHARCRADVTILEAAILDLMAWWDRNKLGRWTISGAGSGWNAYRHRETHQRTVVDPDPAKVAQDREGVHGGRRGVWVLGDHRAGPFLELDFQQAYPTIARELPLPVGRGYAFETMPTDDHKLTSERWGMLARVRVRTDVPRWPVKIGRHTWYPVGEFWTTLAGPDIAEAARLGCLLEIGPGQAHQLGYSMAPWADWVLSVQNGTADDCPPVARLAAKSWGRSVIGKWAARSFDKVKLGPSPVLGWGYEEGWDHATQTRGGMVDMAGQRWWTAASGTPDNAYPAVLAWVEAHVRVRLGRVVEAIGAGSVLQADTDGLIVAQRTLGTRAAHGHLRAPSGLSGPARTEWVLSCLDPVCAPLHLRVKRTAAHVSILGPQHLTIDTKRRYAGLPGMAEPIGDGVFKAKLWPKLQWQLAHGDPAGYVRPVVTPEFRGPYPTGWVLADNTVVPLEVEPGEFGKTRAIPWPRSSYARAGAQLGPAQHPQLERFW